VIVTRPELAGCVGAVSSTHWLASAAGMAALEHGGNAFDAAVAAGLALQVVEPHSNGLGGDVCIVAYSASSRTAQVVCGQGPMPQAATASRFRDLGLRQVPGSGVLPACVPGAFGGWLQLLAEHGTLSLATVLDAAIGYAARGFPALPATAQAIAILAPLFRTEWPESGRVYLDQQGKPPTPGKLIRNTVLAGTLQRIVRTAERAGASRERQIEAAIAAFYQGFVADAIGGFVQDTEVLDATGRRHRGFLTAGDLAAWRPQVETPARLDYGPYSVCKPGPWSQGPVFLQQLALLTAFDLPAMGLGTAEYIHTLAEVAKVAMADREAWYGDPGHSEVPLADLLSPSYAADRCQLIGADAALSPQPGAPDGRQSWMPWAEPDAPAPSDLMWMRQLQSGMPTVVRATARSGDTCTVAVADRDGNLVAAVPSGGWLKSSPVIPGLGFSLGTRGQTMWLDDGHPNSLAPGKRPRTTLSPTVALRDGEPFLAFGTPGGDQQDQWTLQTFLAVTEFGLDLQAATEISAFHSDHFPSSFTPRRSRPGVLVVESSVGPAVLAALEGRGHEVDAVAPYSLGKVCAAGMGAQEGLVRAAAGPRGRQAYAACR
jgi:gamma-glutamyltranspeptidase / glutathione hydrolase